MPPACSGWHTLSTTLNDLTAIHMVVRALSYWYYTIRCGPINQSIRATAARESDRKSCNFDPHALPSARLSARGGRAFEPRRGRLHGGPRRRVRRMAAARTGLAPPVISGFALQTQSPGPVPVPAPPLFSPLLSAECHVHNLCLCVRGPARKAS